MPQVPRYSEPQVQPGALPDARLRTRFTPEGLGGSAAQGLGQAGQAVTEMVTRERQRANEVKINAADRELLEAKNQLLWDPEQGVMHRRGEAAFEARRQALEQFDQRAGKLRAGLVGDAQIEAFDELSQRRRAEVDLAVQRHVGKEIREYDDQTTDGLVRQLQRDAANHAGDPEQVAEALDSQERLLRDYARRNRDRLPMDQSVWLEQRLSQARSATHTGVIQQLIAQGRERQAKDHFERHGEAIDPEQRARLESAVADANLQAESRQHADAIVAEAEHMTGALAQARGIEDTALRDAVTQRVREHYRLKDQAERQQRGDTVIEFMNELERGAKDLDALRRDPRWYEFPKSKRDAIVRHAQAFTPGAREGESAVETDLRLWYRLDELQRGDADARRTFMTLDLTDHLDRLSRTDFKELARRQRQMLENEGQLERELNSALRTSAQIRDDAIAQLGIEPESEEALRINRLTDELVRSRQQELGRRIYPHETQQIMDGLTRVIAEGGWWEDARHMFEEFAVTLDEVPADMAEAIALEVETEFGREPSAQDILAIYNARVTAEHDPAAAEALGLDETEGGEGDGDGEEEEPVSSSWSTHLIRAITLTAPIY